MCRLVLRAELVSRVEMGHIQRCGVSCLTEASSSSLVILGEGLGRQAELSCSVSPALQPYSALTELGWRPMGLLLPTSPSLRFAFTDAHSLSFDFIVAPQPRPGQPWCEVQGQVDRELFLSYDCGHAKIIFTRVLGEEVKTIKAWETQVETLRDIRDWIRDQLHDFTLEKHTVTGKLESRSTGGPD